MTRGEFFTLRNLAEFRNFVMDFCSVERQANSQAAQKILRPPTATASFRISGQGERIRTSDLSVPNRALDYISFGSLREEQHCKTRFLNLRLDFPLNKSMRRAIQQIIARLVRDIENFELLLYPKE